MLSIHFLWEMAGWDTRAILNQSGVIVNTKFPGAWVCSLPLMEFQGGLRRRMRPAPFLSSPVLREEPAIAVGKALW